MLLSNVNIGSGPSAGDGDPLRTAFNTINNNFAKIQTNVNALTNSVSSVAGRTGNITLTTQDIVGINNYATISYVSSQIANVSGGNVNLAPIEANIAALQADVNTLYGNAGIQSSTLATLTSNAAAQAGSLATLTSNAAVQAGELATLIANAAAQAGQIAAAGGGNYGDSNVASYLTTYGGNVSVGNVIFDDLSVQTTAYTGTQWRSNLTSSLTSKPSWLSYYPGLKNQEGTQYGFDAGGMFFTSNSDNDFAYPIQTNLHFHETDVLEIVATIFFSATNNDQGLCIFPADTRPIWRGGVDTSRIAFQYTSGIPVLYGQTTANTAPGSPVLTAGNYYTIKFTYDPTNTVTVETFSGNTATGSALDSRTLNEVLPAGDYRIGFDADNDAGGVKSYFKNLIVRTLTNTVVNDLEIQGQITGNLIPSANVTYSLGDSTHQWKDLWVSNNTIYLNGIPLGVDAGGNLLVNGAPVSGGTATGITSASTISITNADSSADINILSGDDITIQGKNKTTSDSEGGDITINAGNGGNADEGDAAGSGGDITIRAGQGGIPSAAYNGGFGGTLDLYGGTGGDSDPGNNRSARDGGRARLQAGSAGSNNGNVALGAEGGPVEITAGQTTLTDTNGGPVIITSGQAGANALAGYVEINIPGSDIGPGGSWYFTGTGRTLEAPQDGEIWQPNAGNLTVASAGNVFVRSYDGDQHEWQFGHNGDLTIPGNITMGPGSGRLISVVTPAPGIVNWEFGMDGNLTVPGNINHANGVNILSGLGSADFNNVSLIGTPGNLTIQSPAANNTTTVTQEGGFGGGSGVNTITGGVASSPGFALIQPGWTVTGNNLVGTTTVTNVSGPDGYGTYTITTDTTEVDPFWYNDVYTFTSNTPSYSNLVISSGNIVSGNSRVNFIANSSGDGNGYSTIELRPDADLNTDQYIIVDPTGGEPGHIHLRAGGTQDASGADLYLGGELTAVRVSDTSGIVTVRTTNIGDPNITMDWAFQPDGNLYFPGIGNNRIGESEPGLVVSSDNSVVLQSNNAGTSKEWLFNANASITFPDMTVQTTAWTGTVAYGNTIALGYQTGNTSQGNNAVAIGSAAGQTSQGAKAIGIGEVAGRLNQGIESVGLGAGAGEQNQGAYAIAIGSTTAYQNQGVGAVAIGTSAGALYQGEHAIAIGTGAGAALQGNNSIILNATGSTLDQTTDDTFTVKPIRAASAGNVLYYDPSSGEITYSTNSGGGSYGNANVAVFLGSFGSNAITTTGNISAANVRANNNVHFGTGNARITSDDNTSVYLTPDTAANALAGVKIGGNGYLLASNGARNITLNYGSVNGAVGLQANVTVGTSASSILTVNGNVTANNISTIGSILSTGASGKIGYSAGGYVVQSGNTSGVTLNTVSGNIQLDTVNIAVNTSHTVALTNNKLDANDIILVQGQDSSALDLHIGAYYLTTNTAIIYLRNISGSSIGPITPMLKFIIVKAPSS